MANDERQPLMLDLAGPEGNVFLVISATRALLDGEALKSFNREIGDATLLTSGKSYEDILKIVSSYVVLVDSSGTYHAYAPQTLIMAAVDHLNDQLLTLPNDIYSSLEGLYPEFGDPDVGPEIYLSFVDREIVVTQEKIARYKDVSPPEPLQRLLAMLEACAAALQNAGV